MSVPVHLRGESEFKAGITCKKFAEHTVRICANKKIFRPEYEDYITKDIVVRAKLIYKYVKAANFINGVKDADDARKRLSLEEQALELIEDIETDIDLSKSIFHLKFTKHANWVRMLEECRAVVTAWHKSDKDRFAKAHKGLL